MLDFGQFLFMLSLLFTMNFMEIAWIDYLQISPDTFFANIFFWLPSLVSSNSGLLMPFTSEEVRTVQYMIDSYNLSKETYVFSEQNDLLFRRLFQDSESSPDSSKKYDYSSFDVGSLIMTVIKKNVFFVRTIDKARPLSHR